MAFSLALGCQGVKPGTCCCKNGCDRCDLIGGTLTCPKSLRVSLIGAGISYSFFVDCFQVTSGQFPTATIRNNIISTVDELKYTELGVYGSNYLGSFYIWLGFTQYWAYPGSPVMREDFQIGFRNTTNTDVFLSDCIYPYFRHFPCVLDSTVSSACKGVGNTWFGSGSWKAWYDLGVWPQPPIWDITQRWRAALSWE